MKNIVKQIHNEFDTAVEKLFIYAEKSAEESKKIKVKEQQKDFKKKAILMKDLGFNNAKEVKEFEKEESKTENIRSKKENLSNLSKNLIKEINKYKIKFPGYKIITYSQVMKICEKYNLYMGKSDLYTGEIPDKNLEDIVKFDKIKNKISDKYAFLDQNPYPLCEIQNLIEKDEYKFTHKYNVNYGYGTPNIFTELSYHICAPANDFETKNCVKVGNEIFKSNMKNKFKLKKIELKDPIVLFPIPLKSLKEIGFLIITAWGDEAKDELIFNEKNN